MNSAQADILEKLPRQSRVVIVRLRSLGDCVLTTPALELLNHARPDLEIAVVVEDRFADVFRGNPAVAHVLPPSARAIRDFAPELCLNFHGGTRSARLTMLSGAKFRAGFDIFRPAFIYNVPIPTAQEILGVTRQVHTVEHMAAAMFYLGVGRTWIPRARVPAPEGRSPHAPAGPYAVIHAVAAMPEKTWPASRFLEVADFLHGAMRIEPVFIGGAADDLTPFQAYRTVSGAPLAEIAQLMRDASVFAGNDSGPAHIAAAFGLPLVVLFGPSDAGIWAPWRTVGKVIKANGPIENILVSDVLRGIERVYSVHEAHR
jgi:ADP-heptose:LPS heptosyltransferase